jgi:hypothetical protein
LGALVGAAGEIARGERGRRNVRKPGATAVALLGTGVAPAPRGVVSSLDKHISVESLLAAEPGVMARLVGDMVPFGE